VTGGQRRAVEDAPVLLCFRQDLRLHDNEALAAAVLSGRQVLPVFIHENEGTWRWGAASRWWLHHSLTSLARDLSARGLALRIAQGEASDRLFELANEVGATAVYWNRRYEPDAAAKDEGVIADLATHGVKVHEHSGYLLQEPGALKTGSGGPYQVFTPYYKKFLQTKRREEVVPLPSIAPNQKLSAGSCDLDALALLPKRDWAEGLRATWSPGEAGARAALDCFLSQGLTKYDSQRDLPNLEGTSRLSAHLHWGEISPLVVWQAAESAAPTAGAPFLRQLVWREFAHHLLHHFPQTTEAPLRPQFLAFSWDGDPTLLTAWQRGETGYPFVDAGMRQLWATGWMHNRVRMVAASFLVKHLLLPWQAGAEWFWDTLVDANLANNTFGWQWTAGCGADAAPYFRIFNPITQGKRFDTQGDYIRRWVPELAKLPLKLLHEPWLGDESEMLACGVRLGRDYPRPIVVHAEARQRALDTYQRMRLG
jgi:deoxyribodipyrimidine photo-lyase